MDCRIIITEGPEWCAYWHNLIGRLRSCHRWGAGFRSVKCISNEAGYPGVNFCVSPASKGSIIAQLFHQAGFHATPYNPKLQVISMDRLERLLRLSASPVSNTKTAFRSHCPSCPEERVRHCRTLHVSGLWHFQEDIPPI